MCSKVLDSISRSFCSQLLKLLCIRIPVPPPILLFLTLPNSLQLGMSALPKLVVFNQVSHNSTASGRILPIFSDNNWFSADVLLVRPEDENKFLMMMKYTIKTDMSEIVGDLCYLYVFFGCFRETLVG